MPVWSLQRWGGQHCSSHTYTRLFQAAVSTLCHSCLNTRSQFFKWMLAPHSMLNIWTKPQQKRLQNKLIESWAEPEQCLVWCLLFQTHQTRWSKSLRFGHLYWRRQARLLLWARLTLTAYEDKAALYESNTPVALIPQRARSQYPVMVAGASIFGFVVIMTVGMMILVLCIQQMHDGGYANVAYADAEDCSDLV